MQMRHEMLNEIINIKFMNSHLNASFIIIDDDIFLNQYDVLTLPGHKFNEKECPNDNDIIYFCDQDEPEEPVSAIAFSTYDGFAIKNIFNISLKIPTFLISSSDQYHQLIQKRCDTILIKKYIPNIIDKVQWILNFCSENNCKPCDLIYFGNDTKIISNFIFNKTVTTTINSDSNKNILKYESPHVICKFTNDFTDITEIQTYFNNGQKVNVSKSSIEKVPIIYENPSMPPEILILDIDGTFTDARMIVAENGSNWRRTSHGDIKAVRKWNRSGKMTLFLTGGENKLMSKIAIATETPLDNLYLNSKNKKKEIIQDLCKERSIDPHLILYAGDNINDLGVMEWISSKGGWIACPMNSISNVKEIPGVKILKHTGGYGAIKELIDSL